MKRTNETKGPVKNSILGFTISGILGFILAGVIMSDAGNIPSAQMQYKQIEEYIICLYQNPEMLSSIPAPWLLTLSLAICMGVALTYGLGYLFAGISK